VLISRLSDGVALQLRRREQLRGTLVFRSSLRNALSALLFSVAWLTLGEGVRCVAPSTQPTP
jgi:hypothetical protein